MKLLQKTVRYLILFIKKNGNLYIFQIKNLEKRELTLKLKKYIKLKEILFGTFCAKNLRHFFSIAESVNKIFCLWFFI